MIELGHRDVVDLREALEGIKSGALAGEGRFPRRYPVNDRISLFADFEWLQDWD